MSPSDALATALRAVPEGDDYFRLRDFEYAQPLYDLAFLLEISAIAESREPPKYRTFSLWRAGYSLDGYANIIDRWLDGALSSADLDYVPSSRIRQYLEEIRNTGTLEELRGYQSEEFAACLRLRSIRGLGPKQLASLFRTGRSQWLRATATHLGLQTETVARIYDGTDCGSWQVAHVIPPLLRFLRAVEHAVGHSLAWSLSGISNPFQPVTTAIVIRCAEPSEQICLASQVAIEHETCFRRKAPAPRGIYQFVHQFGWSFVIEGGAEGHPVVTIPDLANDWDPILLNAKKTVASDLHCHTVWSDGITSMSVMAQAMANSGLAYFAITDHSRSSKLQGGLTPIAWLRQAAALTLVKSPCPILHGIEVDILANGELDLPRSLLMAADIVVGSVHSAWSPDPSANTRRLANAIETGLVDILAHPTASLVGKPGTPNYVRAPAANNWQEVFDLCAKWRVALEFNCFPSRLDLSLPLLEQAIVAGCAISLGSDAHARSHLLNLGFGEAMLRRIAGRPVVLNRFAYEELTAWIRESRSHRQLLRSRCLRPGQVAFSFVKDERIHPSLRARIRNPERIPPGSRVVGIDLTAGNKATGIACIDGSLVRTCSLNSDSEILSYIQSEQPKFVSIDSPLGLPGGGKEVDARAGIVRVAESDLASIGIPAYPALIDSMKKLTLRGIGLRAAIEQLPIAPQVIESYPGAAQDILCIPRKQDSLALLREGLRCLGLEGPGLETQSHDEMDAITSAIVGRYFETGQFEAMGIPSEAQLIVPKVSPLAFEGNPIICLAGKTGAGKSVLARYLSVFYGFTWIRTRDVICDLLRADQAQPPGTRMYRKPVDLENITEHDLRQFGCLVFDVYQQRPLQQQLTHTVARHASPVVIDSIRGTLDLDRSILGQRPILIWLLECPDSRLHRRLAEGRKLGRKRLPDGSPVDRSVGQIRSMADAIITNAGGLEELRFRVDDALWSAVEISRTVDTR